MEGQVGHVAVNGPVAWRPRAVVALLGSYFALFGILIGAQGVLWADIIRVLGMSDAAFGTVQLVSPLLAVVLLLLSGQFSTLLGKKRVSLAGLALLLASCVVLAAVGTFPTLLAALFLSGMGNGLLESAMNGTALDWERARGRNIMNTMHALFSAGAVVGALSTGWLVEVGWSYRGVMLLVAALFALTLVVTLRLSFPPADTASGEPANLAVTLRLLGSQPTLTLLALICMLGVFGEGAAATWSVIYLRDDMGASPAVGGIAFALFNGAMFGGRLGNELLVARLGARASLLISGALMTLAAVLLVAAPSIALVTTAMVLLGLAVAGVVPTVLTAAGLLVPGNSGTITGGMMAVAYTSFVIGAPLVGFLAELFTLRLALLSVGLGGAALLVLALRLTNGDSNE